MRLFNHRERKLGIILSLFILERVQSINMCQSPSSTFSGTYGHQTLSVNTSSAQPAKGNDDAQHIYFLMHMHSYTNND